jgi:hypothetical protein
MEQCWRAWGNHRHDWFHGKVYNEVQVLKDIMYEALQDAAAYGQWHSEAKALLSELE